MTAAKHMQVFLLVICAVLPLRAQTNNAFIDPSGMTVETRFKLPKGYERLYGDEASYAYYLRHLRMMEDGAVVKYFDGAVKANDHIYAGVLNVDMGLEDLQQDAELCIRLKAEYLFDRQQYDKIAFTISTRVRIPYVKWVEGMQIVINDKTYWTKSSTEIDRYRTLRRYLDFIFTHADINTLLVDVQRVPLHSIQPGDLFVQDSRPGHAVIVLDVAEHPVTGDRIYLLAQSYRPAQIPHVLMNPENGDLSPWYSISTVSDRIPTPEYLFHKRDLRRFREVTPAPQAPKKGPTFYF